MLSERNASVSFASWFDQAAVELATTTDGVDDGLSADLPELVADESLRPVMESVTLAAVLLLLILFCVVGNAFVIAAIALERDLRGRPQYYLIFSLAVADLIRGHRLPDRFAWAFHSKYAWSYESVIFCHGFTDWMTQQREFSRLTESWIPSF
ncbi:unnamed protein product [Nippostrongylus brasiliensis]|uniref:G_PROTEIN_RECEP_F1_2 domain-containing protein n=1 Tax=Nippostrongylus brasiliensis TaxID=27835 RepID=A0A0N4YD66_NIPBR|nr:unnamed protein product [Nippostrongylus brasiliensis]